MGDPTTLYRSFANISDVQFQTLPVGYGLSSASHFRHTLSSWAVAAMPEDDWLEYYLVEIDSSLYTGVGGTMKVNGYCLDLTLTDEAGSPLPGVQLVDASPDTTEGSTSYTTSLSQTITSSVGIFGDTPTANIGASTTVGHSVTRSVPDIQVTNRCYAGGQDGRWNLDLAEAAPAQGGNLGFTAQMLFRLPPLAEGAHVCAYLVLTVTIEDHDNNGSAYYDRTMGAVGPELQALNVAVNQFDDRGCVLTFPAAVFKLRRPKHPVAAAAGAA